MTEIFGTEDQIRMLMAGEDLMRLLHDDPRFCSHGRGVQLSNYRPGDETVELTMRMTRLIGVSGCEMVPNEEADTFAAALEAHGLVIDRYMNFMGTQATIEAAREVLASRSLPDDLTVRLIDREAPAELLKAFADVALAQGVLPSAGSVMRGISRPGFGMVAIDTEGRPVATTAASHARHRDHPDHAMAQWGQLATRDDRKGQGIARVMAARSIVHAAEHLGTKVFSTGIRAGNVPSENLCRSLMLVPSDYAIIIAIDSSRFGSGRATK